jgi:hypothetical protein
MRRQSPDFGYSAIEKIEPRLCSVSLTQRIKTEKYLYVYISGESPRS